MARDVHVDHAVAKVVGWTLLDGREHEPPILIISDIVSAATVNAAARRGVALIAAGGVPTAPAVHIARRARISIVGLAADPTPGLFCDGGHIV